MTVNNQKSGVIITANGDYEKIMADLLKLMDVEVLVGFPEDTTNRPITATEPAGITNAAIAFINDQGAPEQNIPPRPFMEPGIKNAQGEIADKLGQIMKAVVNGKGVGVIAQGLQQVGALAASSIRLVITDGIDPPLAEATLRARANRGGKAKGRKGAVAELAIRKAAGKGMGPTSPVASTALAKPLYDTGELVKSISWAIRSRKARK